MVWPTGASEDMTTKRHVGPGGIVGQKEGAREELKTCD